MNSLETIQPVRVETHIRCAFAQRKSQYWLNRLNHSDNILQCLAIKKLIQARRIYLHYMNEFQTHFELPLSN